jgi:hypothetical protein
MIVGALRGIALHLVDPVPDRPRNRLELSREVLQGLHRSGPSHHLPPEFRWSGALNWPAAGSMDT